MSFAHSQSARRILLATLLLVPAVSALAVPLPEPRPAHSRPAGPEPSAPPAPAIPAERPWQQNRINDAFKGVPLVATPLPAPRPPQPPTTPQAPQGPEASPPANPLAGAPDADPVCAALAVNGHLVFETAPPIANGACGAPSPVKVSAVNIEGGGTVAISPAATMRCAAAQALADWVRGDVVPAAKEHLKEPVVELKNAASYDCRGRNRVAGAKLSEHGRANAIDIGAFKKESGGWIEVGKLGDGAAFFAEVREKSCGRFTTVLGPGSDGYHEDHLHLDVAQRGRNKRALYCR